MAGKSVRGNALRGSDFYGYFVSGKQKEYHTSQNTRLAPQGLTATGGDNIYTYSDPTGVYRTHEFVNSGTFSVTAIGRLSSNIDYLVVAGGGGGGNPTGGGGGAGGFRTNVSGHPLASPAPFTVSTSPGSYSVVVGGGGGSAASGSPSVFAPGYPNSITATGGGAGGSDNTQGSNGGSGGGGGRLGGNPAPGGLGNTPPTSPPQGNVGGQGSNGQSGGGGGGAGGTGDQYPWPGLPQYGPFETPGGIGSQINMVGVTSYYAGGGGGASNYPGPQPWAHIGGRGGLGGGGRGGNPSEASVNGTPGTGGGGGGGGSNIGSGGKGVVFIRYRIN
jgi:hypothetical protein